MKRTVIICTLIALVFSSCEYRSNEPSIETSNAEKNERNVIRVIRKLENPYSVSNMKKAYTALQKEGKMSAPMNIEATHLYVRFLPKDTAEIQKLYNDTTMHLFQFPLDCELSEGTFYQDPELKGSDLKWLYTRVPVGYVSPISGYEVLEELYLPAPEYYSNQSQQVARRLFSPEFASNWEVLEEKSLELTGNLEPTTEQEPDNDGKQLAPWYPKARIRVYDDLLAEKGKADPYIPVPGALICTFWWFDWQYGVTDENGYATINKKKRKVNWSLEWRNTHWEIRDFLFFTAIYKGGKGSNSNWYLDINDSYSKAYAHVNRAAYTMFYGDNLGTHDKNHNNIYVGGRKIKITVSNKNNPSVYGVNYGHALPVLSQMTVYMKYNNKEQPSNVLFATTVHELIHSFHAINMNNWFNDFYKVSDIICESWAEAAECYVTSNTYQKLLNDNHYQYYNMQGWAINKKTNNVINGHYKEYTPIFIDLIDNYNQSNYHIIDGYEFPNDNVTGYTLEELRWMLRTTFNLSDLKRNVKEVRNNSILLNNIDKLFETYEKIK